MERLSILQLFVLVPNNFIVLVLSPLSWPSFPATKGSKKCSKNPLYATQQTADKVSTIE